MENEHIRVEIYVEDNTEITNLLYKTKGYRRDVYVKYNNKFYKMTVFSFTCLKQHLKNQYELLGTYRLEPNSIIVKNVSMKNIVPTILDEAKYHYFDRRKECEIIDGEIMYPLDEATKMSFKESNWPISFPINKLIKIY